MRQLIRLSMLCGIALFVYSCTQDATPFSGVYQCNNSKLTAVVLDSTLCMMVGRDTAFFYNLHYINDIFMPEMMNENEKLYIYGISYSSSLTRLGYNQIECNISFELDKKYGNSLIATFEGNKSAIIGGLIFKKPVSDKQCKKIFDSYIDILTNNLETVIRNNSD